MLAMKDNPDYSGKQKAIEKILDELSKGESKIREVGADILVLAPLVKELLELKLPTLSIPQIKDHLSNARKLTKNIDSDIKKIDEVNDALLSRRVKIADAECPNNAELKGQALEKVGNKLTKLQD